MLEAEKNQIWIPSVTFVNTATENQRAVFLDAVTARKVSGQFTRVYESSEMTVTDNNDGSHGAVVVGGQTGTHTQQQEVT